MADWTSISANRKDVDSPIDEDLVDDIDDNCNYLYERVARTGTDAVGVRLALARGDDDFVYAGTNGTLATGTVTFATDADDGDPNFDSAPRVVWSPKEKQGPGVDWDGNGLVVDHYTITAISATQFTWEFRFTVTGGPHDVYGTVNWVAFGAVTAGE